MMPKSMRTSGAFYFASSNARRSRAKDLFGLQPSEETRGEGTNVCPQSNPGILMVKEYTLDPKADLPARQSL